MENRIDYQLIINGLNVKASYRQSDIDTIFIPFLKELTEMQKEKQKRLIVFFAAAPGTGKSTLLAFLQYLSTSVKGLTAVQALGMDGFHYHNHYLKTHHIANDRNKPLLYTIKGKPETFNVRQLKAKIKQMTIKDIYWPEYSRKIHDVIDDSLLVNKKIVLIEGNYLLLNQKPWNQLKKYADYTVFIDSDSQQLQKQTIERKIQGGSTEQFALEHYEQVDGPNIELVKQNSQKPDVLMEFDFNTGYKIK